MGGDNKRAGTQHLVCSDGEMSRGVGESIASQVKSQYLCLPSPPLPSFIKRKASRRKIFGARSLQFLFLCQKERWGWLGGSTICLISSYLVTLRPDRGHTTSWAIFIGGHLVNPLVIIIMKIIMKIWIIMKVIVKIILDITSILFWSSGQLDAKGVAIAL